MFESYQDSTGYKSQFRPAARDETTPYEIIEQHTYLDLDKDGYKEPYIVTFDSSSGDVFRITAKVTMYGF